jgi:hypothetical protein
MSGDPDFHDVDSPAGLCAWLFSSNVRVHPAEGGQHIWPDIAVGPDGVVGAAWMDDHAAGGYHIFYSSSTDGGATWSTPEKVDSRTTGSYSKFVDLDFTPTGIPVVVWEDNRLGDAAYKVYLSKRDPAGGGTWTANIPINTAGSPPDGTYFMNPSLAVLDDLRYFVAWTDWREGVFYQVYCRGSWDGGATWGNETRISDEIGYEPVAGDPCLIVDPTSPAEPGDEILYCVTNDWRGDVPGGRYPNAYFYRSTDGGATWSVGVRVNDIEPWYQQVSSHALVRPSDGSLTAGWLNNTTGVSHLRTSVSADQGATWAASVQVDPPSPGGTGTYSSIVASGMTVHAGFDLYEDDWNAYFRASADGGVTWDAEACRMDDDASGAASGNTVLAAASPTVVHGAWSDTRPGFGAWKIYTTRGEEGIVSVGADAPAATSRVLVGVPNPCAVGAPVRIVLAAGGLSLGGGTVRDIGIYDVYGRRLHSFRTAAREFVWSGIGPDGRPVAPGVYWVRVDGAGGKTGPYATSVVRVR